MTLWSRAKAAFRADNQQQPAHRRHEHRRRFENGPVIGKVTHVGEFRLVAVDQQSIQPRARILRCNLACRSRYSLNGNFFNTFIFFALAMTFPFLRNSGNQSRATAIIKKPFQ